jgi:uncharacterized protein
MCASEDQWEYTMAGSLRDQLVKSGLATIDQARKAERQARAEKQAQRRGDAVPADTAAPAGKAQARKSRKGRTPAEDPNSPANVRARAQRQAAEKAARDRELARIANEKATAKALRAEIKQIAQQNDQRPKTASDDDVPYNFLHGKKVKRIYVTREQQRQLSNGSLVIINDDGRYHMVSAPVAEQIRARDPKRIIAAHDQSQSKPVEPGSDEAYYAKFQVPDDLDW